MKKVILTLVGFLYQWITMACPVCEKKQPKWLKGVTHGVGPNSSWDWVIVSVVVFITILILLLSFRYVFFNRETNVGHIKYQMLNQN